MKSTAQHEKSQIAVAELFSPPRFSLEAQKRGQQGIAFDLKQGWNLLNPLTQRKVDALLDELCPELLIVCPPCTYSGGWEHLNSCYRTPLERAKLLHENRARLKFSRQQRSRFKGAVSSCLNTHGVQAPGMTQSLKSCARNME